MFARERTHKTHVEYSEVMKGNRADLIDHGRYEEVIGRMPYELWGDLQDGEREFTTMSILMMRPMSAIGCLDVIAAPNLVGRGMIVS